jgi:hypothetical protein
MTCVTPWASVFPANIVSRALVGRIAAMHAPPSWPLLSLSTNSPSALRVVGGVLKEM